MRVLLDTCVISENLRPNGEQRVKDRVRALPSQDTFLSTITIGEIAKGVALLDHGRRRETFARFLLGLEQDFESRMLGIDVETARIWGETTAAAQRRGKAIPPTDGLIAATAIRHGLHLATRNVADFAETGVMLLNPWEDA